MEPQRRRLRRFDPVIFLAYVATGCFAQLVIAVLPLLLLA
jgi:hypothetical protein